MGSVTSFEVLVAVADLGSVTAFEVFVAVADLGSVDNTPNS